MRIKAFLGYTVAALMLPGALFTFIGMDYFSHKLVDVTGIKVSPIFTGGEILTTVQHDTYQTLVHKAVFAALIGESNEGFVQIDFTPNAGLPDIITENIDYNNDNTIDFQIKYDKINNTAVIVPYSPTVLGVSGSYILKERRAVRINLHK